MLNETVGNDTHAQISLQPIAAPSILGLYGLAGATFMKPLTWLTVSETRPLRYIFFRLQRSLGGLAQFLAGMWAYKARDGVATAIHGMWGSFWMAYGVLNVVFAVGKLLHQRAGGLKSDSGLSCWPRSPGSASRAAVAENRGFVTF